MRRPIVKELRPQARNSIVCKIKITEQNNEFFCVPSTNSSHRLSTVYSPDNLPTPLLSTRVNNFRLQGLPTPMIGIDILLLCVYYDRGWTTIVKRVLNNCSTFVVKVSGYILTNKENYNEFT